MKKAVVSFLGEDKPGILHLASRVLSDLSCNILEVSQTILQSEFAAIVIASMPDGLSISDLKARLGEALAADGVTLDAREFLEHERPAPGEPFVVTVSGQDSLGIIAGITGVISRHGVNILSLKAISRTDKPGAIVIFFEVDVPAAVDLSGFRDDLKRTGAGIGLDVSVQHRDIFEAIHRL